MPKQEVHRHLPQVNRKQAIHSLQAETSVFVFAYRTGESDSISPNPTLQQNDSHWFNCRHISGQLSLQVSVTPEVEAGSSFWVVTPQRPITCLGEPTHSRRTSLLILVAASDLVQTQPYNCTLFLHSTSEALSEQTTHNH